MISTLDECFDSNTPVPNKRLIHSSLSQLANSPSLDPKIKRGTVQCLASLDIVDEGSFVVEQKDHFFVTSEIIVAFSPEHLRVDGSTVTRINGPPFQLVHYETWGSSQNEIRKEKRRHADKSLKRRSRTSKHKTKPKKTSVDEHRKKLVRQKSKNRHYHGDDELLVKLEKLQKLDRENETISSERDIVAHKTSLLKRLKERDHKFNKTWLESVASNHRRDRLSARTAITKSLFNIDQTIIISVSDGQLVTTLRNRALATATKSSLTTVALLIDLHRQMEQLLPRNNILDTIEECIILSADSATRSNLAAYFTDNTAVDFAKRLEISLPFNPNGSCAQQVFPPHSSPTPSPAPFVPQHSSQVFAQRGTGVPPAKSNTPRFNKPRPNTQSGR
ncbi:hypothetical protein BLNAU_3137 [Blattamonas nauphoetae]|uniref:Uncharacterized protein n=1 Tax=Blattamonas nauphoetae TaxID=2049346 RepID=A0ABQ9YDC8_9EUKA|nr:hypothetical protein BLNAU_3137 [Blattamonas nauphoetae]